MFLIIPLSLAFVAFIGAAVIVWRKMPYLRKLTPEAHEVGTTIFHDFAPEVVERVSTIPWRQYVHTVLVEFEKLLRRGRLLMSALDRASDKVIRSVRRVHQETAKQQERIEIAQELEKAKEETDTDEIDMDDPEQLRQEEQRLIVAIAQNPKDAQLYSDLARVYLRLQNYPDAVEALEAAAKLTPDDEQLAKRLERARRRREQADKDAAAAVAQGE
ncbi:MAG: tetratricopeptide repeat protein [Candidatus Yanofskybacteria bacterium]|nr:tetratricopeptide repeat protein [Candidatus Yanofskybacteria bacterium]